ncbi:MAG TPA: ribokinase, partial [Planctomycetaceae bacterium]|nr:ribokinase [Planctomycetaceae bacterium]
MTKKAQVIVVGSSNTDMILQLDRIPRPGETILGGEFAMAAGGKGANQAVAAARAGAAVTFVARVGRDIFGDQAIAGFEKDGIDVTHVTRDPVAPSGVALIFVAGTGENSIGVASGANARLSPQDVRNAEGAFASAGKSGVVLMQLETPLETVEAGAELAAEYELRVILNPAPARELSDELLRRVSILTPNETEAELLTGVAVDDEEAAARAGKRLLDRGVDTVILTLGARGALVVTRGDQQRVPAFPVEPVDTTAAGDVFNGVLAVALAEGLDLPGAVRLASAAALSVTRLGA